uniref:Uncharacterized protein n=1 Tax=Candidatus Enterococcus dunnyi TaxID=1834192 RepID=A0A200JCT1_9ENTE|nr:hypothetical protein A5889_000497 [Enterococcus sp. 9D6_DIV0238]
MKGIESIFFEEVTINLILLSFLVAILISFIFRYIPVSYTHLYNDNRGINYYGVTFFEESGIKKLNNILINWKNMFDLAPENFQLKTEYDIEEMIFVKEDFAKEKVIIQLEKIINLCNEAENTNQILVHFGI